MNIGYTQVSTDDQTPDLQQVGCNRIFTDKATGARTKRLELMKYLRFFLVKFRCLFYGYHTS